MTSRSKISEVSLGHGVEIVEAVRVPTCPVGPVQPQHIRLRALGSHGRVTKKDN